MIKNKIKVYRNLMGANDVWARKTRRLLKARGIPLFNLIGSPGSGKTSLLEATAAALAGGFRFAVLEGDVETTRDAERMNAAGVLSVQLITGGECHLSARLVHRGLKDLPLDELDFVVVENVGNLICPAEFDIGETAKVAVLSVTEGEEKPLKYPALFREAKSVVLTKTDLLPHVPFSVASCLAHIRQIHAGVPVFQVSALKGKGVNPWVEWLKETAGNDKKTAH